MIFPWTDWQFWAVTLSATWGLWILLRQFLPASDQKGDACAGCASGAAAQAKKKMQGEGGGQGLVTLGDRG